MGLGCDITAPSPDSNPDNNGLGDSDDGMVDLTLRIVGPTGGQTARIQGFQDSGSLVHDDLIDTGIVADINLTLPTFTTTGEIEQTFTLPAGTQLTLLAIESPGFLTATPPPDVIESVPTQFVQWSGDVTGDAGSNPGALFFVLNNDKTVVAEFKPMQPVFINAVFGGPGSNVVMDVVVDRYVVDSDEFEQTGVPAPSSNPPHVVWGYHRAGAMVTFTVRDYIDNDNPTCTGAIEGPCYVFESWTGGCEGSGKACVVDFIERNESTIVFVDANE